MNNLKDKSIILFDGVCNLCNSSVNFILKHDKKERYLFASLQSDAAREILLQFTTKKITVKTIILIENKNIYDKSTAVLMITSHLNNGFQLFSVLKIIPKFLRDGIYMFIAKNRYKWFGKKEYCMLHKNNLNNRFLDFSKNVS